MSMPDPNFARAATPLLVCSQRDAAAHVPVGRMLPLVLATALAQPSDASAATYRVGGGSGCTHATIQAAVNSAAANAGFDTIRITRSLSYTNQNIVVEADTAGVEFIGGYADCQANAITSPRTVVSGAGGSAAAVFSLRGTATVIMVNLEITGGDNANGGGGIEIIGGPKTVALTDMLIRSNQGRYGGGISAINTTANTSDLQVLIGGDTSINNNTSLEQGFSFGGGGIYCENASVRLSGNTYLLQNTSNNYGGGIAARSCAVDIGSAGLLGGVLMNNHAARDGGGLYAMLQSSVVNFYTVDPAYPATIIGNTAGEQGGGVHVFTNARVSLYDTIVRGNIAALGGAFSVEDVDGSTIRTTLLMQGSTVGAPSGARNCDRRERCNLLSGNIARNSGGTAQPGAVLAVRSGNDFSAVATLRGTRIEGNSGQTLVDFDLDGDAIFDGALIEGNTVTGPLFDTSGPNAENLVLAATTIAGNSIGAGQPVISARNVCAIEAGGSGSPDMRCWR